MRHPQGTIIQHEGKTFVASHYDCSTSCHDYCHLQQFRNEGEDNKSFINRICKKTPIACIDVDTTACKLPCWKEVV
jgi:hypothetical protein